MFWNDATVCPNTLRSFAYCSVQSIETARCLAEGVLTTVHDANIGSIFGIGFPGWTGGALQFIYGTGIDEFCERAAKLAEKHGPGFAVTGKVREAIQAHQPRY